MLSKLPAWVGLGAFLLALAAGAMNVFVLESVVGQAVTHHSGSSSSMMLALSRGEYGRSVHFGLLIIAFVSGSVLSGFIIRDSHLRLGRRYGLSLLLESATVLGAWAAFDANPYAAQLMLSAASGLQNALATTYSGAIVRTTHLTGVFTDIGILLGNRLAGIPMPERKLKLLSDILAGFLAGGLASGLLYPLVGNAVLALPAFICGGIGTVYFVYRRFFLRA
ncbi:MAG: DUF1275 domain-containing protein [Spirochaetes bacterium]|nr:DUF1275 domain-containing protein [Spirochaetota bacterium]MBU1082111.1 DUF1275 domain-containing protein [Spirochaetota bacterium]